MTPTPEFRENSRERGARSPAYRSQRFDPPSRGTDFRRAKRESVPGRGAGRGAGREPGARTVGPGRRGTPGGRTARSAAGWLARGGRQTAEAGRRARPLGPQRGHVAAAAGLSQQPGKQARRAAKANVGPNLGGSRASRAVPNLPGPVCGQKGRKSQGLGLKTGTARHRRDPFLARVGRGGRRFGKNTVIRRRKKLHKPRSAITDPGAGADGLRVRA